MNNILFNIAVMFIAGTVAIGCSANHQTPADHTMFEGGIAITDTSKVSRQTLPWKMRDGRLWWHGSDGLYLQDGNSWQKFTLPEGGSFEIIRAFMQARNGTMWFAGVYKAQPTIANFTGRIWRIWDSRTGLGEHEVGEKFAEDIHGGIWIRTQNKIITTRGGFDRIRGGNGVLHFDGETWHNYTVEDGLIHNRVYDVEADSNGGVWIATLRGLSHYKGGKWTSHLVDSVLVNSLHNGNASEGRKVYDILFDRTGTLWAVHGSHRGRTITRLRGGISSFDGTAWTYHNAHAGLPISALRDVQQTENGDLWFGTHRDDQTVIEARGLMRYKNGMWLRLTRKHGISGDFVCVCGLVEKGDGSFYLRISHSDDISYRPPTDQLTTISGKVTDQRDSQPVANMGIWVEYDDGEVHAGTMTDENGLYRVEVTPGVYRVRIASKNAAEPVTVEAKLEDKIKDVDLLLLNSRRISGRVLDKFDNPIANAVVVISGGTPRDRRLSPQVVITDANGKFEGWQVTGPQATFDVAAEGYAQTSLTVENTATDQIAIAMYEGTTLRGRVVDESDQPIVGAYVTFGRAPAPDVQTSAYTTPPPLPFQHNIYTDASGLFTFQHIDVDKGQVWVTHPEINITSQKIATANGVVDVQVKRLQLYSVSGVVSLNEESIEGLGITAFPLKKSSGPVHPEMAHTDANGAYRLDDLEPGEYHISLNAPEEVEMDGNTMTIHRPIQVQTLVIEDRDVTLNFEPLGDARITGVATYNDLPISDVYVSTHIVADGPENFVSISGTKTDKDGRFELRDLPSGRIAISLHKMDNPNSGGKRWSKIDTVDLRNKKELSYMAELEMEERATLSVGDIAPEFEALRLDDSTFRLADYRGKKAVLIDFWATWCGPCIDEIPMIKSIAETYRDQGLEVVGVSLDYDEQALRDFVKEEKLSYVQVFDKEKAQTISKSYGVWGIPSVFLVDKNGVINAMKLRGNRTKEAVKKLLDAN